MRDEDRRRLAQPHAEDQESGERGLARALGVATPQLDALADEILADLSVDPPFGVAWWAPYPGASRRILISDQLYSCATSVAANLGEAALHLLEFLEAVDRESDHLANVVAISDRGDFEVKMPRSRHAADDAISHMADLHVIGVARALSAALDCLGGAVTGVLALPTSLLRSDLDSARRVLGRLTDDRSAGRQRQLDAGTRLEALISASGPQGWLTWLLAYRNMVVHRGRRIVVSQLVPRLPVIYGPDRRPIPRMRVVRHLPRDAGRSDIEVLLDRPTPPVLTEDAARTLDGVIRSTHALVEGVAALLLEVWRWRRTNPAALPQPPEQWRDGVAAQETAFRGYAEGSHPYEPAQLTGHPILIRRMRAAALNDEVREQWNGFD